MQKGSVAVGLLWAAVAALVVMNVVLCLRVVKLQDAVARVEARPAGGGEGDRGGGGEPGAPESGTAAARGGTRDTAGSGGMNEVASTDGDGGIRSGETAVAGSPVRSPKPVEGAVTEKDVEAMIEKKLAERDKKNPLSAIMNYEDPMAVMERELKLSDLQKTRIAQHRKERDEAMMDLWNSEEGRKNWRDNAAKAAELGKTCDEAIKRELTLDQQEKYESLKKSGKLLDFGGGGASIVIDHVVEPGEPAK